MESRLRFNIRCESADDFSELFGRFTEAALLAENSFSIYPEIILDGLEPQHGELAPDAMLCLIRSCSIRVRHSFYTYLWIEGFCPCPPYWGGERHPLSGVVPAVSPLQWFFSDGSDRRAVHPFVALDPGSYR